MKAAVLVDRGVVKLSGDDAKTFLNGLVTTDVTKLAAGLARFGALLTPQGKIVTDFLVTETADGVLWLDCPAKLAAPLATKLGFYKLRAKVVVENVSDRYAVTALWGGEASTSSGIVFADPRHASLGQRMLVAVDNVASLGVEMTDVADYDAHRIALGVPNGGVDFGYNDAFPHEANMDRLHGVDFDKGCYVGQEVVSRMQHRGTARTRIVRVLLEGQPPLPGAQITAGGKSIGTLGSSIGHQALALLRLDRAADALGADAGFRAGDVALTIADPDDLRLPPKQQTTA
jgi:folate-binding protein YgfZ